MADALLGAFLQVLFDRLASHELLDLARGKSLVSELNKLKTTLNDIKGVLADAEDRDMRRDTAVSGWLDDLKDLVYDADDLLDELAMDETLLADTDNRLGKCLIPSCCSPFPSPGRLKLNCKMTSKVKKINARFNDIKGRKNSLSLMEGIRSNVPSAGNNERLRSTTSLPESRIFGRDKEKEEILKLVIEETQGLSVIPILGMGGLGKTTLAQSIYNDKAVQTSFDMKAWACVSDEFNMMDITRTIVQEVGGNHDKTDLNGMQVELKECLSGRKFLIVLDDVWSEDYNSWTVLRKPFESSGLKGSKIIVTTRSQSTARIMKSNNITEYRLQNLSDGDSWDLLAHHALDAEYFDQYPYLKPEAEKIIKKCGGLPLATKSLGGLLRSSKELGFWKDIAESNIWDLPDTTNSIPNALNLSYVYLPSHLKRCFVYCAAFSKDYEFSMYHLISLWMAEGLLKKPNIPGKSTLDIGLEYFQQLSSRSFFQPSSKGESMYLMHDLMNDLAASKARESCLSLGEEGTLKSLKENMCPKRIRHLSLIRQKDELASRFEGFHDLWGVRTFLSLGPLGPLSPGPTDVADKVIDDALCQQKRLRVLSLFNYKINAVPTCIGSLRHLRYLNLTRSNIQCLPTTMSTLHNLETIILCGCERLSELPSWITKLINLRCIDVRGTSSLCKMPEGLGDLVKLEILPRFIVGGDNGARLKELKDMPFLALELNIEGLCCVAEVDDARYASLNAKTRLTSLNLSWRLNEDPRCPCTTNEERQKQVLDSLEPHARIKHLGIEGYGGINFPSWIGQVSFDLLERVALCNCRNTQTLPTLGFLPALKEVIVADMNAVCVVGPDFLGRTTRPFQCLETLDFDGMPSWEEWSFPTRREQEKVEFPQLRKLKLRNCPKLNIERWPDQFPALVDLVIEKCPLLQTHIAATSVLALEGARFGDCDGRVLGDVVSMGSLKHLIMFSVARISELSIQLMRRSSSLMSLRIEECDDLISLWEEEDMSEVQIEPSVNNLSLEISRCNQLVRIGAFPPNLTNLSLWECGNLEELPNRMLSSVKRFEMKNCSKVRRFLEWITNSAHGNGTKYPSSVPPLPQLHELIVHGCFSLIPLQPDKLLAPSLKRLVLANCEIAEDSSEIKIDNYELQLENIYVEQCQETKWLLTPELHSKFTRLTSLSVMGCTATALELERFPQLPGCLRELSIDNCPRIKALPQRMHEHMSLQTLYINSCPGITSFPEEGDGLPPNLETLWLIDFQGIMSFSEKGLPPSLKKLWLNNCPGITSFPEEGLLPNLEELFIQNCENLRQPMSKWGFHRTTALKNMRIGQKIGCLEGTNKFPPEEDEDVGWCMLPPTLTELGIRGLENIESLSSGMRTHLTLLKNLDIRGCPKLKQLPREGFPASLCSLSISGPDEELKRRLKQGSGGSRDGYYFHLIERIPRVNIH